MRFKLTELIRVTTRFNPLSTNPQKWSHANNSLATADEWFECV